MEEDLNLLSEELLEQIFVYLNDIRLGRRPNR